MLTSQRLDDEGSATFTLTIIGGDINYPFYGVLTDISGSELARTETLMPYAQLPEWPNELPQ